MPRRAWSVRWPRWARWAAMLAVPVVIGAVLAGPPWSSRDYAEVRLTNATTTSTPSTAVVTATSTAPSTSSTATTSTTLRPTTTTGRPAPTTAVARVGRTTTTAAPAPSSAPPFYGTLKKGASGEPVRQWQARMGERGWRLTVDGKYDDRDAEVCTAFQRQKGLRVSGEVDESTWKATWNAPLPDQPS